MADSSVSEWEEATWAAGASGKHPDWADVMWYGADAHGRIGMFTSAGQGPIPRSVFRDLDAFKALGQFFRDLPVIGKSELLISFERTIDWKQAAERGIFAFDYNHGYRLIGRPTAPLSLSELPEWVRAELSELCLQRESFAEIAERIVDLSGIRCGLVE